jgi:hypothetical protein
MKPERRMKVEKKEIPREYVENFIFSFILLALNPKESNPNPSTVKVPLNFCSALFLFLGVHSTL